MPIPDQEAASRAEELFSRRDELFGDRRLAAKAYDLAMLNGALTGQIDLLKAYEHAMSQAYLAAGLAREAKNIASHPASVSIDKTLERGSQTLAEDTSNTVLRQVGDTLTQEISRVVQDALTALSAALEADIQARVPGEDSG